LSLIFIFFFLLFKGVCLSAMYLYFFRYMTRTTDPNPVEPFQEPERELSQRLRAALDQAVATVAQQFETETDLIVPKEEDLTDTSSEEGSDMAEQEQPLNSYGRPASGGLEPSIVRPPVQENFEIKSSTINMVQNSIQFYGKDHEDPSHHIAAFLELCCTFSITGASDDAIRLRLFPFSLRDRAKSWLKSLPAGSIRTWEQMAQLFVNKYFPPEKTAKLKNRIMTFRQDDDESLHIAWERFRDLLIDVPHHGMEKKDLVNIFYQGLDAITQDRLDVYAGGDFGSQTPTEAYNLIEKAAQKSSSRINRGSKFLCPPTTQSRQGTVSVNAVNAVDTYSLLTTQIEALSTKFDRIGSNAPAYDPSQAPFSCDQCGISHEPGVCEQGGAAIQSQEEVNYTSNQNRPPYNPYSETYNSGWRDHPNFSWKDDSGKQNASGSQQRAPAPQQGRGQNNQTRASEPQRNQRYPSQNQGQQRSYPNNSQERRGQGETRVQPYSPIVVGNDFNPVGAGSNAQPQSQGEGSSNQRLEEMMAQLVTSTNNTNQLVEQRLQRSDERFAAHEAEMRSQKASIQAIEKQVGQLAKMLSERPQGGLPSNTETNPRGEGNRAPPPA
jgi:hypothetical protein